MPVPRANRKWPITQQTIDKWLSWIGWLTVVTGAAWLLDWAADHAPWAVMTVFGALATLGAAALFVMLAEDIRAWWGRVRREREILDAIALRQPIRLGDVRIELDSMKWGADLRRRRRFDGARSGLIMFGGWTLLRAGMVFFLSVPVVLDLTPTAAMWLWLIAPPLGFVSCAIVAVTNWPRRDRPDTARSGRPDASSAANS